MAVDSTVDKDGEQKAQSQAVKPPLSMDDQAERKDTMRSHVSEKMDADNNEEEDEENKGNLLGKLGSSVISFEKNEASEEDDEDPEAAKFGHQDEDYDRCTSFFNSARERDQMDRVAEYILNAEIRKIEDPNKDATNHDYQKALFYLYGHCEDFNDAFGNEERIMAHSLLKRFDFYSDYNEAKKVLSKQIVKKSNEENEDQLVSDDQVLRFLSKHSKYGKNIKEIELVAETLSSRVYKVMGTEEELAIKIPKLISDRKQEYMGFLDLIFETQLQQFLKRGASKKYFFP